MKKKKQIIPGLQPNTSQHNWGECLVFISPPHEKMGWHMTISHKSRYPSWDEIRDSWYALVPNSNHRIGALILPKKKDYINICENCFQVHELKDYFK